MAEYSKEFIEQNEWSPMIPDFSIIEEFDKLLDGESVFMICEGYGFTEISRVKGKCFLLYKDGKRKFEIG